jgi:hypothetical protein
LTSKIFQIFKNLKIGKSQILKIQAAENCLFPWTGLHGLHTHVHLDIHVLLCLLFYLPPPGTVKLLKSKSTFFQIPQCDRLKSWSAVYE